MKHRFIFIAAACAFGTFVFPCQQVQAEIYCEFFWASNPSLNVEGNREVVEVLKKLTPRGYDRLVESGPYDARVSGNRGDSCMLKHPKLSSINVELNKRTLASGSTGHIPDCVELNATVSCAPSLEDFERDRSTSSTPATLPPPSTRGVTRATLPPPSTQDGTSATPPPPSPRSVSPATPPPPSTQGGTPPPPSSIRGVTPASPPPPSTRGVTPAIPPPAP